MIQATKLTTKLATKKNHPENPVAPYDWIRDKFPSGRTGNWTGPLVAGDPPNKQLRYLCDGRYLIIPVPEGCDGKVWSGLTLNRGTFWFFNVPNYFAFSRDGVPVPKDLADLDGLTYRP